MSASYPKTECFTLYSSQPKAAPMAIEAMNITRDRETPLKQSKEPFCRLTLELSGGAAVRLERDVRRAAAPWIALRTP
jgi:hypothetical protein